MITAEKAFDDLARLEGLYQKAVRRFQEIAGERALRPEELFQYADAQRRVGNIGQAAQLFAACGEMAPRNAKAKFFADRLGGLDAEVPPEMHDQPCPAPLMQLHNFFTAAERERMLNFFLEHEREFTPTPDGCGGYSPEVRNNIELTGNRSIKQPFREKVASALPRILQHMGIAPFPLKKIEVKLRAYQNGQYFRIHADAEWGRRLTFTYYLRKKEYEGGHLIIFDTTPDGKAFSRDFTRLLPQDNCLHCFPSFYYHAVTPVKAITDDFQAGRFAINGHISAMQEQPGNT